jgi:hypothetical protein
MTPSCSPVEPKITRTSRARIRPFTRNCCCRLNQAPYRRSGSAPQRRIFLSHFPAPAYRRSPEHSGMAAAAMTATMDPLFREPERSCKRDFGTGKINLRQCGFSSGRWRAEMSGMRRVCLGVVQHRVERCHKWRHSGKAGKDRAIANFAVEHEGRPLRHL